MLALLVGFGAASPAHAQFNFFGSREVSPDDVSETISEHGFQLVGPLYRNGRVYLADVIDRRRHRERLVISAETGQIVQRFLVDVGPERQPPASASRAAPRDDSFFSHLTRGWDDEPPPRPPLGLDGPERSSPTTAPRPRAQPRVVTRTETPPAAVTATPLPPPTAVAPSSDPGPTPAKPEVVAVPTPSATPPQSGVRGTSVSTDPLRIPGTRKPDEPKPASATVATTKPPEPAPPPASTKPKPTEPASNDVPVAPLD